MVIAGHIIFMTAYIYIYIYVYYKWYSFIHSINKHCPWKKWKKKLGGILVVLLVPITFSLAICEFNYTLFLVHLEQISVVIDLIDQQKQKFWTLNFHRMRYYASLKATKLSNYNGFGFWGHFCILEKLGWSLGREFSVIWSERLRGLGHCDQSPLGTQLGVENQTFRVTFGPKIDRPNAKINIRWVRLVPQ